MATDEELERFYAGFTRTSFTFDPSERVGERPDQGAVIPRRRRRTSSRWDTRPSLPPVPGYIRFDEDGEGYDSRVGRSRKRPQALCRRGSLERSSVFHQLDVAGVRLRELEASGDDPIAERQVRMTIERLHRDGLRFGLRADVLDRLARGEPPYPPRPSPEPTPPQAARIRQRRLVDERPRPTPAEVFRQLESLRAAR